MSTIDIILYVLAALAVLVGLAGSILPIIPGVPILYGGLWLAAWTDNYHHAGLWTLIIIAILGLIAMALDFLAGALGAKRVGASSWALWGAVIGSIVGMFFGLLGLILGPFVGAVLGEIIHNRNVAHAAHVGLATWMGLLFGAIAKLVISFMMIGVFAFALLF